MRILKWFLMFLSFGAFVAFCLACIGLVGDYDVGPIRHLSPAVVYLRWSFLFLIGAICAEWLQWAAEDRKEIMKQQEEIRKLLWEIERKLEGK